VKALAKHRVTDVDNFEAEMAKIIREFQLEELDR
jgi:hypothetical protein